MIDFNWSMRTKMEEAVDEIVEGANENGETIVFTVTIAKTEEGKIYLIPHAEHTVSNEDLLLTFSAFISFLHNEMRFQSEELMEIIKESGILKPEEVR